MITGIGQGFTLTTPLQLAHATATLGMQGLRLKPRLLMRVGSGSQSGEAVEVTEDGEFLSGER